MLPLGRVTQPSIQPQIKMKFFIVFAAVIASAAAVPGIVNTGSSAVTRSDDGHGNYEFGYNEDHATGGTFRKEKGSHGVMVGSYGLRDADGRVRTVNYVADALGYRATISTNEPGVDPKQDPAAASINGAGYGYAAPIAAYGAPLGHGAPVAAYAAPIAYAPSSYSTHIQHASIAAPVLTKYAAAAVPTWAGQGYGGHY